MLRILILFIALAAGSGAAWLLMSATPAPQQQIVSYEIPEATAALRAGMDLPEILVADADMVQGSIFGDGLLRWQKWPEAALNSNFILRSESPEAIRELVGQIVGTSLFAGEPVYRNRVIASNAGYLAAVLETGMRAVAVRVNAENTAGGFIVPNDRVDVLHTISSESVDGLRTAKSETILTNIRVLAIDQMVEERSQVVGRTATLALSMSDVEVVTAAEASGSLSLSLRSLADNDDISGRKTVPVPQPSSRTVQMFRSGSVEILEVE